MVTLYGIKNCDTVRRARRWLDAQGVAYRFHDLRADGLNDTRLRAWARQVGWESLLNRRSATWRRLPATTRESLDEQSALRLMLKEPTLIKRPVLDTGGRVRVGFDEAGFRQSPQSAP
ncbi:MAG TPA: ArsC family reductase [Gammaproteobacteria bacterium]|nr:ArsC family reductase [Gammaproteobacteria bacterium]